MIIHGGHVFSSSCALTTAMAEYCRPANADLLFLCDDGSQRIFAHQVRFAFHVLAVSPAIHNLLTPLLTPQVIFALHSPLLKNIFLETRLHGEEMVKIMIPDFTAEDISEFVKFFYTGEIK